MSHFIWNISSIISKSPGRAAFGSIVSLIGNQAIETLNRSNVKIIISKIHLILKNIQKFLKSFSEDKLRFGSKSKANLALNNS